MMMNSPRRRLLLTTALIVLGIGVVVLLIVVPSISPVTPASCGADCLRFPSVSGDSLSGTTFTLPTDFAGDHIFVVVPFDEAQQTEALDWLPLARELAETSGLTYYNAPTFPSIAAPVRAMIRAGLTLAVSEPELRDRTITLFLEDRDLFLAALDIPNPDALQVFLLNAAGEVLWRGAGTFTETQGEALRQVLTR